MTNIHEDDFEEQKYAYFFEEEKTSDQSPHLNYTYCCISPSLPYFPLVEYLIEVEVEVVTRNVPTVLDPQSNDLLQHQQSGHWRHIQDKILHLTWQSIIL